MSGVKVSLKEWVVLVAKYIVTASVEINDDWWENVEQVEQAVGMMLYLNDAVENVGLVVATQNERVLV